MTTKPRKGSRKVRFDSKFAASPDPTLELGAKIGNGQGDTRNGSTLAFYYPAGYEAFLRLTGFPAQPALSQSLDIFVASTPSSVQREVGRLGGDGPIGKMPTGWYTVSGPQAVRGYQRYTALNWYQGQYQQSLSYQYETEHFENGVVFHVGVNDAGSWHQGVRKPRTKAMSGIYGDMQYDLVVLRRQAATWPVEGLRPLARPILKGTGRKTVRKSKARNTSRKRRKSRRR